MIETAVLLKALTSAARLALGGATLEITTFPFRVGRESRLGERPPHFPDSRRQSDSVPNNDLYLVDPGNVLNVSREHFLIDRNECGYFLVDRGSACGTIVEGESVGERKKGGTRQLNDEDVVIVGTSQSRYIFKFLIGGAS